MLRSILFLLSILQDKRWKKIVFILFAVLFHYSAIITIVSIFIKNRRYSLLFYLAVVFASFIVYLFGAQLVIFISNFLPGFSSGKIMFYLINEKQISGLSLGLLSFKIFILVVSFLSLYRNNDCLDNEYILYFFNLYFLSVVIYLSFSFKTHLLVVPHSQGVSPLLSLGNWLANLLLHGQLDKQKHRPLANPHPNLKPQQGQQGRGQDNLNVA